MQVRRRLLRDAPRRSAFDRHNIDERLVFLLRVVANTEPRAVGRNQVIVVAARGEAGIENLWSAAGDRNFLNAAVAIEE